MTRYIDFKALSGACDIYKDPISTLWGMKPVKINRRNLRLYINEVISHRKDLNCISMSKGAIICDVYNYMLQKFAAINFSNSLTCIRYMHDDDYFKRKKLLGLLKLMAIDIAPDINKED